EMGADMVRYYFCWDVAPYETQKFNADIAKKEIGKILNVLWNLKNLVSAGKIDEKSIENKWILSRLENVTKNYLEGMENFQFQKSFRELSSFILDDLSRKYIQSTRDTDNGAVILHCLKRVLTLLAPVSIFLTEKLWQS